MNTFESRGQGATPLRSRTVMAVPSVGTQPAAEKILARIKDAGVRKNSFCAAAMRCLAVDPDDKDLLELIEHETLSGLIELEVNGNPFVSHAPVQDDFPDGNVILGRVPETGALWRLSDEPILCHILGVGASGLGGKTSWMLMFAAELLMQENGGIAPCPFSFQNAGLLNP